MWTNPRKQNVSAACSPRFFRFAFAYRPNSMSPRLVRVKLQSELPQSPAEIFEELPSIFFALEPHG